MLSTHQRIEALLEHIADQLEGLVRFEASGETSWTLEFDRPGESILLSFSEGGRVMGIETPIGTVPEKDRASICEGLLRTSNLWFLTAGTHFHIREDGTAVQRITVFLNVDSGLLLAVIRDQREKAEAWRSLFAKKELASEDPSGFPAGCAGGTGMELRI